MKKYILIVLISFANQLIAQNHLEAPWMQKNTANEKQPTYTDAKQAFEKYWEQPINKARIDNRASGFKPFMRDLHHWEHSLNPDGYIITAAQAWEALIQKNDRKAMRTAANVQVPVSDWQPVGPFTYTNTGSWSSGQGRVNVICVDPNNANTIYLGAPAGGLWKSTNGGSTWNILTDNLPQIGISGICVSHVDSNTIYISTGDKNGWNTYSVGVLKSTDGGITWNTTGLSFSGSNNMSGEIIMHPTNANTLWVATNNGVRKTTNGGTSWATTLSGNIKDIKIHPSNPDIVYAVTSSAFYKSTNGGTSFLQITSGLPTGSFGRIAIAVTPANDSYVYLLIANSNNTFKGIYRSTNAGQNFTAMNTTTDIFNGSTQAYYDMAICASTTNAEMIFTGCLNIWKSINGGATISQLNDWSSPTAASYTHADIHYLNYYGNKLYCGSDGGIYVSENDGTLFIDKTAGAQIGQFYKIAIAKNDTSKMMGGLQDNGGYAFSNNQWKNYYGADGMDTAIDPTNSNKYYGFIQYGSSLYVSNTAGNNSGGSISKPTGETGNWVTPLTVNNTGEIFAGYNRLYKLVNNAWQAQSTDVIGANSIELIEIDPQNNSIFYVANSNELYKSTDGGINFMLIYTFTNSITSVEVNNGNSNIVYVTTSGNFGEVLKSTDGGASFSSISAGLPNISKHVIKHQGFNPNNPLFLGTYLGVYYLDDTLSQWQEFDTNLPNVKVTDLEISENEGILIAATYGRGIWKTNIPVYIAPNEVSLVSITTPIQENINCSNTISPQITIKNGGTNVITSANILYFIDNTQYNYTWSGNLLANQTIIITLPTSPNLATGEHTFSATVTIPNDYNTTNNTKQTKFYTNQAGTIGVVNVFSNPSDNLLAYSEDGSVTNSWKRTNRSSSVINSGGNIGYTTNSTTNYANNVKAYLVSGCYNLSNVINPQISFSMMFDLENLWDITYMEYSTNGGITWQLLGEETVNWYNNSETEQTNSWCTNCPGGQWTGTDSVLKTYTYPLNALSTETNVMFRFVFHSDDGTTKQGVFIDNFVITGTLSTEEFDVNNLAIYPNPSNGIYNLSYGDITIKNIEIFDVTGKIIYQQNQLSNDATIDITNASAGVYFVKISAKNQEVIKKIIKK